MQNHTFRACFFFRAFLHTMASTYKRKQQLFVVFFQRNILLVNLMFIFIVKKPFSFLPAFENNKNTYIYIYYSNVFIIEYKVKRSKSKPSCNSFLSSSFS